MLSCPHCEQQIAQEVVICPHCRKELKAFGHQGIPLHYAAQETYLCDRCLYHRDDSCNFPQRPYAKTCTLYQDYLQEFPCESEKKNNPSIITRVKYWISNHQRILLISLLLIISVIVTIATG